LIDDIVPFVDRTYRTDPDDRCLHGYSAGGFFVVYALPQQSRTFHRYLSGSGFGYSTMGYLCDEAQRVTGGDTWRVPLRPRPPGNLAGHVFVAMAEHEAKSCVSAMHEFVEILEAAGSSDLHLVSEVFPTETPRCRRHRADIPPRAPIGVRRHRLASFGWICGPVRSDRFP
jgi:hypothetical protein